MAKQEPTKEQVIELAEILLEEIIPQINEAIEYLEAETRHFDLYTAGDPTNIIKQLKAAVGDHGYMGDNLVDYSQRLLDYAEELEEFEDE